MRFQSIASKAELAGHWSVIALGVSIPISVVLDNILMALIALFWLLGGGLRDKMAIIRQNPVAVAALILFGLLAVGMIHGDGTVGDLAKYIDLLFVPIFLSFFQDTKVRERALLLFGVAVVASVIVSYLAHMGLLADNSWLPRIRSYPIGFKSSITHSLIVAFCAFLFALLARQDENKMRRAGLILLILVAIHNIVFVVYGRTGYVVLGALFIYFFVVTFGRRGLMLVTILGAATFFAAYTTSETFRERILLAAEEAAEWKQGEPSETSVGLRLEFYVTSLKIVREHPLIGSGTGSFPAVYERATKDRNMVATSNPHNEYLLIAVQIGLLGLACLLYLFYTQWRLAGQLAPPLYRDLARGLVLTFAVGCLFNSLLLDHTEGLLFAWMSALVFAAPVRQQPPVESVP